MQKLKLALLGFGNVSRAFTQLLMSKAEEIGKKYKREVMVTAIATGTRGNLVNPDGIDLQQALTDLEVLGRFRCQKDLTEMTAIEIVRNADYDVLVEMTPLNIKTGQPAISHIEEGILRRKHIVTANKGPIAWAFSHLRDMAHKAGVGFFYETTVMDGAPVFNMAEHTLMMAKVTEVSGILNTTTNFILEEMAKGTDRETIMARGREMGFIEADPAMDIEGYDAAAKITALLNVLMDANITPDQVERKGIEDITEKDIKDAADRGNVIKLLCSGTRDEAGRIHASVQPREVSVMDFFATVNGTTSAVSITTDLMKKITITEHDPEIQQTAYGVFGDVLRVLERIKKLENRREDL